MTDQTPPSPSSQRKIPFFIGGALLVLVLVLGGAWLIHRRQFVWTNDAYLDGYQISISADINARLITLYVDEGDIVEEGQLLCQLDESIYNSKKQDAETAVALLQQQVVLREVQVAKIRDIYNVALQEYENEIISYIAFDKIEKDFLIAEAEYQVAKADLANGIAKLGVIEEWLRHTKVYAPRKGAIAKRWVVAGDAVQFGQPLFLLTDTQNIWVTANFEETKVEHINHGDQVKIHIDAYPDITFYGTVFVVRASAAGRFALIPPNNATGNFTKVVQRVPIKIWLDVPKTKEPLYLYPGMSVEVDIHVR